MKSPKAKKYQRTQILLNEKLPTDEEIEKIKATMIINNNLHTNGKMQYPEFTKYYLKYGGVMPEDMFAQRTLDIERVALCEMREDENNEIPILLDTTEDEIQKLKEKMQKDSTKTIARLQKRVEDIIEKYSYTELNVGIVKKYLDMVQENVVPKNFDKSKLDFLKESIEFAQGGRKDIEYFAQVCIAFRQYQKANRFISENIDNATVKKEERAKLRELQKSITHTIKREKAINMIYEDGVTDIPLIMKETGLPETEILQIRKIKTIEKEKLQNPVSKRNGDNKEEK